MKEIRSIEVAPADEDKTVQLWMSFGWELKNNQRVKTQDVQKYTGQDSDGTKYYQTTQGVDFIKLTFERDPERKNYAELKALQEQYFAPLPDLRTTSPGEKPKKPGIFGLIMMIISFVVGAFLLYWGDCRRRHSDYDCWRYFYFAWNSRYSAEKVIFLKA